MRRQGKTAADWIRRLKLKRHPEGGWYAETYRSAESAGGLPRRFRGRRALSTAIYFLLRKGGRSRLHRLKSDEVWHFYDGGALAVHAIGPGGRAEKRLLGRDAARGERPQAVVPAGRWFGAEVARGDFALVGCTVAPGFDFRDFEMGRRERLLKLFPRRRALVRRLTD